MNINNVVEMIGASILTMGQAQSIQAMLEDDPSLMLSRMAFACLFMTMLLYILIIINIQDKWKHTMLNAQDQSIKKLNEFSILISGSPANTVS